MEKREQLYQTLSEQYRKKWLKQANNTNSAKEFIQTVNDLYPNTFPDIDNGKDITDYSDSSGGEVIVRD